MIAATRQAGWCSVNSVSPPLLSPCSAKGPMDASNVHNGVHSSHTRGSLGASRTFKRTTRSVASWLGTLFIFRLISIGLPLLFPVLITAVSDRLFTVQLFFLPKCPRSYGIHELRDTDGQAVGISSWLRSRLQD